MFEKNRYTIGEIAELFHVPTKTLRFYEEKGLLKPEGRDENSGYRYYTRKQVLELLVIKDLKHLGFFLSEIIDFKKDKTVEQLIGTLMKKEDDIKREMKTLTRQKIIIEKALHRIIKSYPSLGAYHEDENRYQFELVEVPVDYVVYTIGEYDFNSNEVFLDRYVELSKLRDAHNLFSKGAFMAAFHGKYIDEVPYSAQTYSVDDVAYLSGALEVFLPVFQDTAKKITLPCVKQYGGFLAAKTMYTGGYNKIRKVYDDFLKWCLNTGYSLNGPPIEEYIINPITTKNETRYVTIVYFPVESFFSKKD